MFSLLIPLTHIAPYPTLSLRAHLGRRRLKWSLPQTRQGAPKTTSRMLAPYHVIGRNARQEGSSEFQAGRGEALQSLI